MIFELVILFIEKNALSKLQLKITLCFLGQHDFILRNKDIDTFTYFLLEMKPMSTNLSAIRKLGRNY